MTTHPDRVFLDANVIFSAALGGQSFTALWQELQAGGLTPCTSPQCVEEVRRNVVKKRQDMVARLDALLPGILITGAPVELLAWATGLLPEDDGWVLAGAVLSGAPVLLTGNTRHFGVFMGRQDLPIQVATVRSWLDARRPAVEP